MSTLSNLTPSPFLISIQRIFKHTRLTTVLYNHTCVTFPINVQLSPHRPNPRYPIHFEPHMPVTTTASVYAARRTNTSVFPACRTALLMSCASLKVDTSEAAHRASSQASRQGNSRLEKTRRAHRHVRARSVSGWSRTFVVMATHLVSLVGRASDGDLPSGMPE